MPDQETIARVSALSVTAVKATQLRVVESVLLEAGGARGDRAFFLIDDRDRMVNGKHFARLQGIVAEWDEDDRRLSFSFPDREPVSGIVGSGASITARFFSGQRSARSCADRGRRRSRPTSETRCAWSGFSRAQIEDPPLTEVMMAPCR